MKKALKIGIIALVLGTLIFSIVAYCVWKEDTIKAFDSIIDFINKPLPIVGVSIVIIGGFIYKIFVVSKYGKKAINEYKVALDETNKTLLETQEKLLDQYNKFNSKLEEYGLKTDKIEECLDKVCELSKNIHIKELPEKILRGGEYGEETIDSCETKE